MEESPEPTNEEILENLDEVRQRVRIVNQHDDEPALITICRFPDECGEDPCEDCFRFWHDDPRSSAELSATMKRRN